jgi:hypothetical protein
LTVCVRTIWQQQTAQIAARSTDSDPRCFNTYINLQNHMQK